MAFYTFMTSLKRGLRERFSMTLFFLYFFVFLLGLCWGSFLNVVAYRFSHSKQFFTKRSYCPSCNSYIAWHDNIPILSWIILKRKCRSCKAKISALYPFVELLTAGLVILLFSQYAPTLFANLYEPESVDILVGLPPLYTLLTWGTFISALIFLSALIVAIRTDLEAMVIPQLCTLWLIPFGIIASWAGLTSISLWHSVIGAFMGYGILWSIAFLFKFITKRDGLGVGDMEFLGMIGAFLGPLGTWFTLLIGSVLGTIIGGAYLLISHKSKMTRIPFGPFLAAGALLYFFFAQSVLRFFLMY